jgi:hypothetical protein
MENKCHISGERFGIEGIRVKGIGKDKKRQIEISLYQQID